MSAVVALDSSWSWHSFEVRLLDRLLYKHKNQHRKTAYFHKLVEVRRCVRAVIANRNDEGADPDSAALAHALLRAQRAILKTSRLLYGLLGQTYFMAFALTMLALLARLYATQRVALLAALDRCLASTTSTAVEPGHTLAEQLHRAMRCGDEREWIERCDGCDLFAPIDGPLDVDGALLDRASPKQPVDLSVAADERSDDDDDGDSDEDVDSSAPTLAAAAATLPSQLSFFGSTTAPKTKLSKPSATPSKQLALAAASKPAPAKSPAAASFHTPLKHPKSSAAAAATNVKALPIADSDEEMMDDENEPGSEVEQEEEPEPVPPPRKNSLASSSKPVSLVKSTPSPAQAQSSKKLPVSAKQSIAPRPPLAPATAPATAPPSKGGLKRKQPDPVPTARSTLSPAPASSAAAVKSAPSTAVPLKKKQRLVGDPFAPPTMKQKVAGATATSKVAATPSPLELLSRGLRPAEPHGSSALGSIKKKKKKVKQPAADGDEMDDIFG
jgi:hypothetical protein